VIDSGALSIDLNFEEMDPEEARRKRREKLLQRG
jgi:hypothetical protein